MRRLRIVICIIFAVSCILFAGYQVKLRVLEDHTAPEIQCKEDTVSVSVADQEEALLKGVTAKDNKDGDITDSIRISAMSHFINNKRTVTYVVFDKANNMATMERTVEYTDYMSPKIHMLKPLRFSSTDQADTTMSEYLSAEDCLDGDLTNQIRTIVDNSYYSGQAGTFPVTLQVSNSAGDVCSVAAEMTITDSDDRQERYKEYPLLSEYIAYTTVNQPIDPATYLIGIEKNGTEYTYEADGAMIAGTREAIGIASYVDYENPGVYTVEFTYTGDSGVTAVTKLYVVVEGE
ncbi:MAG: hypothetical protein SOX85_09960 [Lachnospiraceae bacterium]|nr:DUF5011 domain-containing protein [Lachnospiraceae bacterium]MDY4207822.1 hypothetical protein [Lachnospiraceae bacterium]